MSVPEKSSLFLNYFNIFALRDSILIFIFLTKQRQNDNINGSNAPVAELADAPDLGSGIFDVQVQALSGAPHQHNPNLLPIGEGFGFVIFF